MQVLRLGLQAGGISALAIVCACAAAPDAGPHTLLGKRAAVTGPTQCTPKPTPQGGLGCEWENTEGNRLFLTLDEQQVRFRAPTTNPAERLAIAVNGLNATISTYPGFEGLEVNPIDPAAGPGPGWTCASYEYGQNIGDIPGAPGQVVRFRGIGRICVDSDGAPDAGWVVLAELGETWVPSMGDKPSAATAGEAQRFLSTLQIR